MTYLHCCYDYLFYLFHCLFNILLLLFHYCSITIIDTLLFWCICYLFIVPFVTVFPVSNLIDFCTWCYSDCFIDSSDIYSVLMTRLGKLTIVPLFCYTHWPYLFVVYLLYIVRCFAFIVVILLLDVFLWPSLAMPWPSSVLPHHVYVYNYSSSLIAFFSWPDMLAVLCPSPCLQPGYSTVCASSAVLSLYTSSTMCISYLRHYQAVTTLLSC